MEVFATGQHGGMEWTADDLSEIAGNFAKLREYIKPALKLGHTNKILAEDDGQPALGWIDSLEVVGNKLVANAKHVPTILREAIAKKRYARVSSELYPKFELTAAEKNLKTGVTGKVLSGVALLGAAVPAVKNLADLQAFLASEGITTNPRVDFADDEPVTPMRVIPASLEGDAPFTEAYDPPTRKVTMAENKTPEAEPAKTAAPQPDPEMVKLREQVEKQADEHRALLAKMAEQDAEIKRRAEREAAADARARRMEAVAFAESCMQPGSLKCTQAQRPWLIALHEKLSAMEGPLIKAEEGAALKLFGENEKPRDLTAGECLKTFIDLTPDASAVLRTFSTHTDKPVTDLDTAVEAICLREKWDSKDPAMVQKATEWAVREQAHLMPTYGGRALYRQ